MELNGLGGPVGLGDVFDRDTENMIGSRVVIVTYWDDVRFVAVISGGLVIVVLTVDVAIVVVVVTLVKVDSRWSSVFSWWCSVVVKNDSDESGVVVTIDGAIVVVVVTVVKVDSWWSSVFKSWWYVVVAVWIRIFSFELVVWQAKVEVLKVLRIDTSASFKHLKD